MAEIPLGRYFFERMKQIGINSIFGVPGDFNLRTLDFIDEIDGLSWVGNANELNASYAADGYARVKGIACLVTTFGVGELSALNGIAGSYAEHVGVIHYVGVPSTTAQAQGLLLHHTLGDGKFDEFFAMSTHISETAIMLTDLATAPAEIDRIIRTCYVKQRPVYLGVPANFADMKVPASLLDTPVDLSLKPNDPEAEAEVLDTIISMVKEAKNPIILADACCARHNVKAETKQLIDVTQFPAFVTPMGKGCIDEDHKRFGGVYYGSLTRPDIKEAVESSDLIFSIGALLSDFNTGSFSYHYQTKNVLEFHSDHMKIKNAIYSGVQMKFVLQKLLKIIGPVVKNYTPVPVPAKSQEPAATDASAKLTQKFLWGNAGSFLREGDVLITETGTSAFGGNQINLCSNVSCISQVLWGSIGYATGCVMGVAAALKEVDPKRRAILFTGEGSLQLTVQAISDMVKVGVTPYLFVLNNQGYTIEKLIHGPDKDYNNIQPWDHLKLLEVFGAKNSESVRVSTVGEWQKLTSSADFQKNDKIRLIEVMLPEMDAPSNLVAQAQLTAKINAKQ